MLLQASPFERRDAAPFVSTPERVLLEALSEVGVRQSLAEARELVESSYSLRAGPLIACRRQSRPERVSAHSHSALSLSSTTQRPN
jgi:hypothetical protein